MALLSLIQHRDPEKVERNGLPKSWCCEGSAQLERPCHHHRHRIIERKRGHSMRWRKQLNFFVLKKMHFEGVPHKAHSVFFASTFWSLPAGWPIITLFAHKTYIIAIFECCFLFFIWKRHLEISDLDLTSVIDICLNERCGALPDFVGSWEVVWLKRRFEEYASR